MPAWPANLPAEPLRGTLSVARETNKVEFQPDVGSPIRRRRYTSNRLMYTFEMTLTEAQYTALDTFFHDDCEDGTLTFTMTDWITGIVSTFEWTAEPVCSHLMVEIWRASLSLAKRP